MSLLMGSSRSASGASGPRVSRRLVTTVLAFQPWRSLDRIQCSVCHAMTVSNIWARNGIRASLDSKWFAKSVTEDRPNCQATC